jgi:hypothetical protein
MLRRNPVRFVVKASNRVGSTGWIASVGSNGLRAVGAREHAHVFKSHDEALQALSTLSPHFAEAGISFSVEPIGTDMLIACRG